MKFSAVSLAALSTLGSYSSIHAFSVHPNNNRVQLKLQQNRLITGKQHFAISNRFSSKLFAEEEVAVEESSAEEEKSPLDAAADELEKEETEETKEEDEKLVLCEVPPASHSMEVTHD